MMSERLPALSARELIAVLERLGFAHRPLTGTSHRRFIHPDGRRTTVPVHPGQVIGRGLLRKIPRTLRSRLKSSRGCFEGGNQPFRQVICFRNWGVVQLIPRVSHFRSLCIMRTPEG